MLWGLHCVVILVVFVTVRRVVDFLSTTCHDMSQDASNLRAMASWLKTLHSSRLGLSQTQAQKNVTASKKLLSEGAMLGVVDKRSWLSQSLSSTLGLRGRTPTLAIRQHTSSAARSRWHACWP